jgi:hypothetical protein
VTGGRDWIDWHSHYADPDSAISRRLQIVVRELSESLSRTPAGPIEILSLCSGDGRDLITALIDYDRRRDVTATIVELDTELAGRADRRAQESGIDIRVINGDAGLTENYADAAPFDIVLACGIFGNIDDFDVRQTVTALGALLKPKGTAIWTRHRSVPDLTPDIRRWFCESGFVERGFFPVPDTLGSVGVATLDKNVPPSNLPLRLFSFVGDGVDAHR